jgi:hypothetical protein
VRRVGRMIRRFDLVIGANCIAERESPFARCASP